jgi:hypothetical protein
MKGYLKTFRFIELKYARLDKRIDIGEYSDYFKIVRDNSIYFQFDIIKRQGGKTRSFDHPSPEYDKLFKHQVTRPFALSISIGLKWSRGPFFPHDFIAIFLITLTA